MKEYAFENGSVDISKLEAEFMQKEDYVKAHKGLVIACHDVFIKFEGGILLVVREGIPLKGELWPIGGRILRGVSTVDSLRKKVKLECGLEIENVVFLASARVFHKTDPFGHGKGTDTTAFVYYAEGKGELKLDDLHKNPRVVTFEEFEKIDLHPYVRDMMKLAWKVS